MFINGYVNNKCLLHAAIYTSLLQILREYNMQYQVSYYSKAWIFLDGYFISALREFAAKLRYSTIHQHLRMMLHSFWQTQHSL